MLERLKTINPLFIVTVIVPTLLSLLYFGVFASDIYISESRFVVRSPTQNVASPLTAVLGSAGLGGPSAVEGADSVTKYVLSRSALNDANHDEAVLNAYNNADIFMFDRFGGLSGTTQEELYEYFLCKVSITQGATSQVMTLRVDAYDPDEAQEINSRLLVQAEKLVNSLSARARIDSLSLAQEEVDQAAQSAREARVKLAQFRGSKGIVDPKEQSSVGLQMIGKLQDELIAAKTQLGQLQTYTPDASQIPFLKTQINALQQEITDTRTALTGGSRSLSSAMVQYQELSAASQFAEQQLTIALASLQEAQAEARRKRVYVERISNPSLPDYPEEPRRIRSIIATFILGLLAWGILSMLSIGVREHRD